MERAFKEDLFMILSAKMTREDAEIETERIANNFKSAYEEKVNSPIIGKDKYKYYTDRNLGGWNQEYESKIEIYTNGKWEQFMYFNDGFSHTGGMKCKKIVKRLIAGGNTVLEY